MFGKLALEPSLTNAEVSLVAKKARSPWPERTMVANTDVNRFRSEVGGEPGTGPDGNDAVQRSPENSALKKDARQRQPK